MLEATSRRRNSRGVLGEWLNAGGGAPTVPLLIGLSSMDLDKNTYGICARCGTLVSVPVKKFRGVYYCEPHYEMVKLEVLAQKKVHETQRQRMTWFKRGGK